MGDNDRVRSSTVQTLYVVLTTALASAACASGPRYAVPDLQPTLASGAADGTDAVAPASARVPTSSEIALRPVLAVLTGQASYYSDALAGRLTASGEPYEPGDLIAAHPDLPFGTLLRVTNLTNGRWVEVHVIDRGPFAYGRVLDLSRRAAEELDMIHAGHVEVRIEVLEYGAAQRSPAVSN
jgi:rare lipoprotein A